MSLYHHVQDKSDVLDGMIGAVLDEMQLPDGGSWDRRAAQIADELRRVVRAHPHVHTLVVERAFRSPSALGPVAALLDALSDSGLTDDRLVGAFWTLLSFVSGSLSCELADVPAGLDEMVDLPVALFAGDLDAQFELGLQTVIGALGPG